MTMQLSDAQKRFHRLISELVGNEIAPIALEVESNEGYPHEAYEVLAREKLFALAMPAEFGGQEADATTLALMVETISRVSPSAALLVFPSNAVMRTIALTADAGQKERLFAELKDGRTPMGFSLSEPDNGSDAANIQTRAESRGDHYLVTGTKAYVTLGPHARYYLTFVRTGEGGARGISALLIPREAEGLSFGRVERKMGLHGSVTSQMFLDHVPVPKANRLWGENQGWRVLTEVANPMRVWGAASMALGAAQGILDLAVAHAQENHGDNGRPLMADQGIAFALADMKIAVEASRSLNYRVCAMVDQSEHNGREVGHWVSMAKCLAADTAVKVGDLAGSVMGRAMASADSLAGLLYNSAKAIQIFDGSNQVQRMVVSRSLMR